MTEQEKVDDRDLYAVVDKVIQDILPLDPYSRLRVYRTIGTFFGFEDSYPKVSRNADSRIPENPSREPKFASSEELTPKEFILQKQPKTDVERVACLAYYLNHYRGTRDFKTTDINKLNTEAAQRKLSNASNAINNGIRDGYLAPAGKGMKQLSAEGEQYIEALPDRSVAKEIRPRVKPRRSRKRTDTNQAENEYDQEYRVEPNE